ncbi:MAG: NAD(P)H-binding protein [Bdellovibrionota bacterium]
METLSQKPPLKIVIAGASGFVGSALLAEIRQHPSLQAIALTRGDRSTEAPEPNVNWVSCDLYSLLELESALQGADIAVYLVHSMLPSARLTQGSFIDFDLMLADNFARAAKKNGIRQIIYLSGIIPPDSLLSAHLKSRLEVESVLKNSGIPTTCLRAGIIIGPGGSSFEIMRRLVERLPTMLCPSWTSTVSCPVSVWDVVKLIVACIDRPETFGKIFDVVGPDALSYREMMIVLAKVEGVHRAFISVPFVSPTLSRLWVCTVTGAPKNLVYPLVDSLKTNMVAYGNDPIDFVPWQPIPFRESLERSMHASESRIPYAFSYTGRVSRSRSVRSVQRLVTLFRSPVEKVAAVYFTWLPQFLGRFFRVEGQPGESLHIYMRFLKKPLLSFRYSQSRSVSGRVIYYMEGGLLARASKKGRLEFRDIYGGLYKIVAIHEYEPRLPWFIYKFTQALVHLFVMRAFNRYLLKERL